ncbi:MAG TPA: hypothetical protein VFV34_00795 [Blastocatellia bacterium]|nr:hypothetical protein [Blastocatellia bacterium]
MTFDAKRLYELLPAIYRIRDSENGEPLKALISVIAEHVEVIEEDLDQLYDDQFIETCADWVVPYIGDLLGVRALHGVVPRISSPRAEVADTIAFRRRKGTISMLEQLARDVTGWPARAVEFFELLGWTQYMNHIRTRPVRGGTLNLRDHDACELITSSRGAFDRTAHTGDVRRIETRKGRYNIPNIGLFLWRLQAYPVNRSMAFKIGEGVFTFNPLGLSAPLFNQPKTETEITTLAAEIDVPARLRRRALYDELESQRQALTDGRTDSQGFYFGADPVFEVFKSGVAIPSSEVMICDLSEPVRRPPGTKEYHRSDDPTQKEARAIQVAVDPVLGRIAFPEGSTVDDILEASYSYAFSADLGGGPYDRADAVARALPEPATWQVGVGKKATAVSGSIFNTLRDAIAAWNEDHTGSVGVIAILDSNTYAEDLSGVTIEIPQGNHLMIVAADWPEIKIDGEDKRVLGQLKPDGLRPHVAGEISVVGTAAASSSDGGSLAIEGLLLEGNFTVLAGNLGALRIQNSTLVPGGGALKVDPGSTSGDQNSGLSIVLDHSICGPVLLPASISKVSITDSIISSGEDDLSTSPAITAPGADVVIQKSTILGQTEARTLEGENSIFSGLVTVSHRQTGCVRFSFLPFASTAPKRFMCRPASSDEAERIWPQFTSLRYGDPEFCQLSEAGPLEIRRGAEDESEMGAFHDLFQPQRETNLRVRLDEYLRFGLEAGIFFVT